MAHLSSRRPRHFGYAWPSPSGPFGINHLVSRLRDSGHNWRMPERGRPKAPLVLTEAERSALSSWARRRQTAQSLALRSRIVLECADGASNETVAGKLGVGAHMVGKWRARFVRRRLAGLSDEYRSGAPRTITDEKVEAVVRKTVAEMPLDATHWPTRSMARETGPSPAPIGPIWRAFGPPPPRRHPFHPA